MLESASSRYTIQDFKYDCFFLVIYKLTCTFVQITPEKVKNVEEKKKISSFRPIVL